MMAVPMTSHVILNYFPSLALWSLICEMRDGPYPALANAWHSVAHPTPLPHADITNQSLRFSLASHFSQHTPPSTIVGPKGENFLSSLSYTAS